MWCLVYAVALLELINASAAVDHLLTAGVEGVALGADFDLELALNGTALEGLTAGTANDALAVGRMNVLFHCFLLYFWAEVGCLLCLRTLDDVTASSRQNLFYHTLKPKSNMKTEKAAIYFKKASRSA